MTAAWLSTEHQNAVDDLTRALAVAAELPSSAHVQPSCLTQVPVALRVWGEGGVLASVWSSL